MASKRAFGPETETDEVIADIDLTGRTAVVTGASSGIGKETAEALARAGAKTVLAVRDLTSGHECGTEIEDNFPQAQVEVLHIDLADLASIRSAASAFKNLHVDTVVANAGIMYAPFGRTSNGFEMQFGVNHLGHFALVQELLPSLQHDRGSRVIVVTSTGHKRGPVDLADPNFYHRPYDKFLSYRQSKTANILFARELDRRYTNIHGFSVHPGVARSRLSRHMSADDRATLEKTVGAKALVPKTMKAAAATSVWAATDPYLVDHGGSYLADCQISEAAPHATDSDTAAKLWDLSEELTGYR